MTNLKPRFFSAIYNAITCIIVLGIFYLFRRYLGSLLQIGIQLTVTAFILGFFYSYKSLLKPRTSRARAPAVIGYFTVFIMFLLAGIFSYIFIMYLTHHDCYYTTKKCYGSFQDLIFLFFATESIALIYAVPVSFIGCFIGKFSHWLYQKLCR